MVDLRGVWDCNGNYVVDLHRGGDWKWNYVVDLHRGGEGIMWWIYVGFGIAMGTM